LTTISPNCATTTLPVTATMPPANMVTFTFTTTAPSLAPPGPAGPGARFRRTPVAGLAWFCVLLLFAAFLLSRRRPRKWRYAAGVLLVLALAGFAGACGGGGGGGSGFHNPGTPPDSYPIFVSATSGGVTHMILFTLTVR
jgi:hypothetical protein